MLREAGLSTNLSRRQALQRLSSGALLALGLWPGALPKVKGASDSFRFAVVNDTHYIDRECGAFLERVVGQMRAIGDLDFCLHAGDLTEHGHQNDLGAVREIFSGLKIPVYPVIGNHDYLTHTNRLAYETIFPGRLNYIFRHQGWQFVALDSSEGLKYQETRIQPATVNWLEDNLRRLDKEQPTVIFTHFPLGAYVRYRPLNADAVLDRFRQFNLQAVFSGHYHGFTENRWRAAVATTNRCCALKRTNHDGTKEKGFFICEARGGTVTREFVQVRG